MGGVTHWYSETYARGGGADRKSLVVKDLRVRLIPGACSCFMRLLNP